MTKVFEAIKWAGVCHLALLGVQALRCAVRGRNPEHEASAPTRSRVVLGGWRLGFLSNITNPKVLLFYLAVRPQFLRPGAATGWLLAFAWTTPCSRSSTCSLLSPACTDCEPS